MMFQIHDLVVHGCLKYIFYNKTVHMYSVFDL